MAALNSLDKKSLGELKSFGSPAAEVVQVASACIVLTAPGGKIPKDLSWNAGKKMMNNVDQFLKGLQIRGMRIFRRASGALSNEPPLWFVRGRESAAMCDHTYSSVPFPQDFDKDNLPEICCATVEKQFMSNPNFNPDYIRNKSGAAAGLCAWVVNICKYFRIYQVGCTYNCDDETKPTRRRVHKQPSLCVAWWYRTGHCLLSGRLLSVSPPGSGAEARGPGGGEQEAGPGEQEAERHPRELSLIHISEPTRPEPI
eukprot:7643144-Pyramimonas_sp.AAC.1